MWNLWNSFQSLQSLFLFYQLFLRGPWGSVIGYAQTNPLSSKEAISALFFPPALTLFSDLSAEPLFMVLLEVPVKESLSQCHPLFQCLAPPDPNGSASGCYQVYGWWILSKKKKKKKGDPSSPCNCSVGGNDMLEPRVFVYPMPEGTQCLSFNVI